MDTVERLAKAAQKHLSEEHSGEQGPNGQPDAKKRRVDDADANAEQQGSSNGKAAAPATAEAEAEENPSSNVNNQAASNGQDEAVGMSQSTDSNNTLAPWASNEGLTNLLESVPGLSGEASDAAAESETRSHDKAETDNGANANANDEQAITSAPQQPAEQGAADASFATFTSVGDESSMVAEGSENASTNQQQQEVLLARNGRPLNTTKRAAQNRAAQRAFRARRDEYVRQVEEKAKHYDVLTAELNLLKERYDLSTRIIDAFRQDNQALRKALDEAGAPAPVPPKVIELLEEAQKGLAKKAEEQKAQAPELDPALLAADVSSGAGVAPEGVKEHVSNDAAQDNLKELSTLAAAAAAEAAPESTAGDGAVAGENKKDDEDKTKTG